VSVPQDSADLKAETGQAGTASSATPRWARSSRHPGLHAKIPFIDITDVHERSAAWEPCSSRVRQGSGYEQAEAEVSCVEAGEAAVALGPAARVEVVAEAAHRPLFGLRPYLRPRRHHTAHAVLQVRPGAAPVGLEQAVGAVLRYGHPHGAQGWTDLLHVPC
jgi:hypothetical protein